jgi:hypothetical protein
MERRHGKKCAIVVIPTEERDAKLGEDEEL